MDVFAFRDRLTEDYARVSRSFTGVRAEAIRSLVDAECDAGRFWPASKAAAVRRPSLLLPARATRSPLSGRARHAEPCIGSWNFAQESSSFWMIAPGKRLIARWEKNGGRGWD